MRRRAIAYLPASDEQPDGASQFDTGRFDVDVVALVRGEQGSRRGRLREALECIAVGEADTLAVERLGNAAGSLRELVELLDWLDAVGASLVAVDVDLDSGSSTGRRTAMVLRELERCEREPSEDRPPRGRPGLAALAPHLSAQIATMRERGLSLQAIADALNADGVATPRGGARWRPSSVQATLGYRRPRPPVLPPPPAGRPPPAPSRPRPRAGPGHGRPDRRRPPGTGRPAR